MWLEPSMGAALAAALLAEAEGGVDMRPKLKLQSILGATLVPLLPEHARQPYVYSSMGPVCSLVWRCKKGSTALTVDLLLLAIAIVPDKPGCWHQVSWACLLLYWLLRCR